ncbi:Sex hormone-binding globulin [Oryzias melastigma]|uniref:Sex hormone-binding globulin n=1 Tax=Oryzias melastigma TaxID=30732 RepID=A0A834BLD1_ORYME|nr:Sex hormone-binding globulin [Oryzias melastigma]
MAVFWKAVAGGLLLTVSLLGGPAEGQGNERGKKQVSGNSVLFLSQVRDLWRPLVHTAVNLSEINSIKSSFQFRTYDPEGLIFYGDTKNGEDWFVLSLMNGIPLMQISKEGMLVSVEGGMKLNDGKWHTLEVSNQEKFVILEVDGSTGLKVGMQSQQTEEVMSGGLRLALGGILIEKEKMIVQFKPQMDACVRYGNWLNISVPWEAEVEELWPCYENIRPGSYFPGTGIAVFNTSVFQTDEDGELRVELWADFRQMNGTILSINPSQKELEFKVEANKNTEEVTVSFREQKVILKSTFKKLLIMFARAELRVVQDGDESRSTALSVDPVLTTWRDGLLAIGGLLGEAEDGSHFLTGCLEKIQVQDRDLDLDLAVKHTSISSHSCPV